VTPADNSEPKPPRRGLWAVGLVLALLLALTTWDLVKRDSGVALRRAAFEDDLQRIEEILRRRSDLVNSRGTTGPLMRLYSASPAWLRDSLPKWKLSSFEESEHYGASALHYAVLRTNLSAIKILLGAGASPDAMSTEGMTPVGMAIAHQREDVVLMLVRAGANVNLAKATVANPLIIAAECGDLVTNITGLLLSSGASPNTKLPGDMTPLHWAARSGQIETVRMLLGSGAKLDITNSEGFTPLGYAMKGNATNTIVLLQSLGATP
jgi:ankyrin repeat protein